MKEVKVWYAQYADPMAEVRSLVSQLVDSRSELRLGGAVDARQDNEYDWGVTVAAMSARLLGGLMGLMNRAGGERRSLMSEFGFDYGCISIGSDEAIVRSVLGPPVYTDMKHGVDYFGKTGYADDVT